MDKDNRDDLQKLSIRESCGLFRPSQIVGVGALVVTLISGSYGFGVWTAVRISEVSQSELQKDIIDASSKISSLESENELMQENLANLRLRERIVGLIALYYGQKARAERAHASAEDIARVEEIGGNLFRTVMERANSTLMGRTESPLRVSIHKGEEPSVMFEFDGTIWPLPTQLFATAE